MLADTFGQVLMLQVEDSGPGVPEAERELVFQPFYRALGSEADGSGLGLPIVMEIAAKHHAEVLLEDAHPARTRRGALQCAVSGRRGRGRLTHPPTQRYGCP